MSWLNNLQSRAIAIFLVLALGPIAVIAVTAGRTNFEIVQQKDEAVREITSHQLSDSLKLLFSKVEDDIIALDRLMGIWAKNDNEILETLSTLLFSTDRYQEILLYNEAGKLVGFRSRSNRQPGQLPQLPARAVGELSGTQIIFRPVKFDQVIREPLMSIIAPIKNRRTDAVTHHIQFELRFRAVWNLLAELRLGEATTAYLTDPTGRVVAHRNPTFVLRESRIDILNATDPIGLENERVIRRVETPDVAGGQLRVVVEQPHDISVKAFREFLLLAAFASGAAVLFIVLAYMYLSESVVKPIRSLAFHVRNFRWGEEQTSVEPNGPTEIQTLSDAFNDMANSLHEYWLDNRVKTESLQDKVDELTEAEASLRLGEMRLQEIIWATDVGTWEWDLRTNAFRCNERWAEITRFKITELSGTIDETWFKLLHPNDIVEFKEQLEKHLSGEKTHVSCRSRLRQKNENWVWIVVRGKVVEWNEANEPVRLTGTILDISDLKVAEEKASERYDQLTHLQRVSTVGELATNLAHELNQPLTSIVAYIDGFLRRYESGDTISEDNVDALRKAAEQAISAGDIIRRLRSFLRRGAQNKESVDVVHAVSSAVELLSSNLKAENIRLEKQFDSPKANVAGDPILLQQVILNLMQNSIEAVSKAPTDDGVIKIGTTVNQQTILVSVEDNGVGIQSDQIETVFDTYYSTKENGLGVGLSICRSIVEEHFGTIDLNSTEGAGTRVDISLPAANSD